MASGPRSLPWSLVPGPFWGEWGSTLVLSFVLSKVLSQVLLGRGSEGGYFSQVPGQGTHPLSQDQDRGTTSLPPTSREDQDRGYPFPVLWPGPGPGYLPPIPLDSTYHREDMLQMVSLLQSHRRTFLLLPTYVVWWECTVFTGLSTPGGWYPISIP